MKTITIKQPWASLICEGIKNVENRTWKTSVRGRVLIHAANQSWNWDKLINYMTYMGTLGAFTDKWTRKWLSNLQTGAIIGSAEIVDCVINYDSIWAEKGVNFEFENKLSFDVKIKPTYNWVLANPILFDKPIPAKGKLSFWKFDMEDKICKK